MRVVKTLSSQKGASSVLVIFMMMVLVTFGALSVTSANVNYKLSRRALEWNTTYYELDGQGETFISALDNKLMQAEAASIEYMTAEGYRSFESSVVAPEVQNVIYEEFNGNKLTNLEVLNKIYMYYADIFVKELLLDFGGLSVYPLYNGSFIDGIYAEASFESNMPGDEQNALKVSVSIEPLSYEVLEAGEASYIRNAYELRYKIEDWYAYQEASDAQAPVELWDGAIENPGGELWDGSL